MIAKIGNIPVYEALISDEECGMLRISLVDNPAVKSNFLAFDSNKRPQMYEIANEEKRLVRGCVMRADFPIYRRDSQMGEFYVIYKADQIRKMAEKYLCEGRQNLVNLMHQEGTDVDCVNMVQYFIKGDGIQVTGFDDIADGSLFAEFHIVNDALWEEVKKGTFKGFSLEGIFDLHPEEDVKEVESIVSVLHGAFSRLFNSNSIHMSKLSKFKAALAKVLAEYGVVTTDKGILAWDGEEDLKAGDAVFVEDAEGNRTEAEDGEYRTEDNKVIVVEGGHVAEIKDAEAEVAPEAEAEVAEIEAEGEEETEAIVEEAEEVADEVTEVVDNAVEALTAEIERLTAEVERLTAENEALRASEQKLRKMSAAEPAHKTVETSVKFSKTGVKGLDRLAELMSK